MLEFLFVFQILLMLILIGVILLQPSKGEDYGGSQMFSARGAGGGFVVILTTVLGALFFLNSIFMAQWIASQANLKKSSHSSISVTYSKNKTQDSAIVPADKTMPPAESGKSPGTPSKTNKNAGPFDLPKKKAEK